MKGSGAGNPLSRGLAYLSGWHRLSAVFHDLGLWSQLALTITVGFLLFFTIFSQLSIRMANASMAHLEDERLVLTRMAAAEIDGYLSQAFGELEKALSFARFDAQAPSLVEEYHVLAHAYTRVGPFSIGSYFLNPLGEVVFAEPEDASFVTSHPVMRAHILRVIESGERQISAPFTLPGTDVPVAAITIPVVDNQGRLMSLFGGFLDLSGPDIRRPIEQALKLGQTGHAELVDSQGIVVASTEEGVFLRPGDHSDFYRLMMSGRLAGVATVPYTEHDKDVTDEHVMAFAPLNEVDWGVSIGGSSRETFAPVAALRSRLGILGGVTLVVIVGATLVGARYLVRPMKTLTRNAQAIAKGNLAVPILTSGGGGEMATLARSFDEMRQKLRESFDALESRVEERTRELERATEELGELRAIRELDRLKTEFISSISHELRTPLGLITGYASTLLRDDIAHSDATRQQFLEIIGDEANKLEHLVEDLLDTSRIQAGSFAVETSPMNVVELARQVVERMQPVAEGRVFVSDFDPATPAVLGDSRRLEQVLRNLLSNAIKYSQDGSRITIGGGLKSGKVEIRVVDEGRGIPEDKLGRIFDAFYRVPDTTGGDLGGAGLGLTISKAIVEAHAGSLWVESAIGKGSVFGFTLPTAGESG